MSPELPGVAAVLEAGVAEGIAPAASACVLRGGQVAHASCHGTVEEGGAVRPIGPDDLFDVASLTKVLAITGVAAQLVEEGKLALDDPAARRLPELAAAGKGQVTVRQLLAHSSGLPAWRPYFEEVARQPGARGLFRPPADRAAPEALRPLWVGARSLVGKLACGERLEAPPGARALYSDVGFILLGLLLEAAGGAPLPALCQAGLFGPLGLRSTFFLDGIEPAAAAAHAAGRTFLPTGHSRPRGAVSRGEVNDDNAWAMGGVAGHAGLFSTAAEVAALGQAWLEALDGRASVIPSATARAFARRDPTPGSERALGWDTPGAGTALGERLGRGRRGAVGHLGYTGTSLWIDLDAGLVCALLTNHTHPSGVAQKERIRALRRRFHDAVAGG